MTFEVLFSKNKRRSSRVTMGRRGGSRERKGFMVKVWWAGQQQQEDELVEELPDCYI
jgi:IMP dehydrogenase/GMP reductase